jgi:oxygen-independent coproporphyrinogen-3 oxidase
MGGRQSRDEVGIYIHVPFCSAICNYCNFNRGLLDGDLKRRYVDALVCDIGRHGNGTPADTIYFGGGTPSLLEPDEIARLVVACRQACAVAADAEITLEMNPETAALDRLCGYRAAGVTRLSIGVQSFRDEELRRLGRIHDAARAREAVRLSRAAGFGNISLDLMMWLPQQTVAEWLTSVDALIAVAPDHASLYILELYPNAPLKEDMARGGWSQAPEDDAAEMYLQGLARLEAAGYRQYEISNVARPGYESRHNLKYWRDGEWLAFGCGAHGTRHGRRTRNVAGTEDYIQRVASQLETAAEVRVLSEQDRLEEALFTGLRLTEGLRLREIEAAFHVDVWERYGAQLLPFVVGGLLERSPEGLRLTREGMLLANEVCSVFV